MGLIKNVIQIVLFSMTITWAPTALAQDPMEPSDPPDDAQNEKEKSVEEAKPAQEATPALPASEDSSSKEGRSGESPSFIDYLYNKENRFYTKKWSENLFSKTSIDGISSEQYGYAYRHHFPIFASLTLAPGFDITYLDTSETIGPYLEPTTGKVIQTEIAVKYLALALGARLQAGLDYGILSFAPYLDYRSDIFAKSLVTIKDNEEFDGEENDGGKNRRFVAGGNLYFNFAAISFGIGMEWGSINGDFGSSVGVKGIHLVLRGG